MICALGRKKRKEFNPIFFASVFLHLCLLRKMESPAKRPKREECPHKERCYRKNPHHFKQFEHAHLLKFLEMGDSVVIPEGMPQPTEVYLEQLKILRPIFNTNISTEKISSEITNQNKISSITDSNLCNGSTYSKAVNSNESANSVPSCSSSSSKRLSSKGKTTMFKSANLDNVECASGSMLERLQRNAPYNLFFTTILKSPETRKEHNAVTFTDLLCPSLGTLKCSLQINFMIDIDWLLKQYKARNLHLKPLTIVYGDDWPDMAEFIDKFCPNVKYKYVKPKDPFGIHHSKVGIYVYEDDSVRVVVSTANLYYEDWNHYNQGLWISPRCPKLPQGTTVTDGESLTGFKSSLLSYLTKHYSLSILKEFVDYIKNADFSSIKVALVYSAPGKYYPKDKNGCHLHVVGRLLSEHCSLPAKTTPQSEGPLAWGVNAQASSIGSLGTTPAQWLRGNLLRSLASHKQGPLPATPNATLNVIYPSVDTVANGYFGLQSGGCLPYSKQTNEKQKWFQEYLHQWVAEKRNRTKAMPHIKSYCRVSPCLNKLAYFLLTSANLSKSAWGSNLQKDGGSYVRSFEVGVLFLPKFFDEEYFEINNTLNNQNKTLFPLMYDLPLTPYASSDYPWCN